MIYIDCDGVLADFDKRCKELTGRGYSAKDTWIILEKVDNLFLDLDILPNAVESVSWLLDTCGYHNVQVLTALPLTTSKLVTAQRDKVQWVHTNIDHLIQVNCVQHWSYKKYFVEYNEDILIDDSERNIKEWEEAGGIGILHTDWETSMLELKEIVV